MNFGTEKRLCDLSPGENGIISRLLSKGDIRRRLQDVGFIEGTHVACVGKSPLGDPTAYLVRGTIIALRREDGYGIFIK